MSPETLVHVVNNVYMPPVWKVNLIFWKLRRFDFRSFFMNNSKFSRMSLALLSAWLLFACTLFVGCKNEPPVEEASLVGKWTSAYGDGYIITENKLTYDDGGYGFGWEADIAEISDDYIYVKYSSGKYFCVAYKGLTETTCSFSNAYKASGKTDCETLDEAKSEFTIENEYFAYYSECSKVE